MPPVPPHTTTRPSFPAEQSDPPSGSTYNINEMNTHNAQMQETKETIGTRAEMPASSRCAVMHRNWMR